MRMFNDLDYKNKNFSSIRQKNMASYVPYQAKNKASYEP